MRPITPKSAGGQVELSVLGVPSREQDAATHSDSSSSSSLARRSYTQIKELGKGRSSTVWLSTWRNGAPIAPGARVAVKRRWTGFTSWSQSVRCPEVQLFRNHSGPSAPHHPHIVSLFDIFLDTASTEMYFILEPLEGSLRRLIKARKGLHFPFALLSSIFQQAVSGVEFLHSLGCIHRALDTEAILVTTTGLTTFQSFDASGTSKPIRDISVQIKIGSFGSSTRVDDVAPLPHYALLGPTSAPEMIMKQPSYDASVDLWSLGTVFGEVINLRTLFSGRTPRELFEQWCDILGTPTDASTGPWSATYSPDAVAWALQQGITSLNKLPSTSLRSLISFSAPDSLVHCIRQLLQWNPTQRLSATELLAALQAIQHETFAAPPTAASQLQHQTRLQTSMTFQSSFLSQVETSSPEPDSGRSPAAESPFSPTLLSNGGDLPPRRTNAEAEADAVSLAPSYYSRLDAQGPSSSSSIPHPHPSHRPPSASAPGSQSQSQFHLLPPNYDDIAPVSSSTSSSPSNTNGNGGGLGDYFARVLSGGSPLITATTAELRNYILRTPRLRGGAGSSESDSDSDSPLRIVNPNPNANANPHSRVTANAHPNGGVGGSTSGSAYGRVVQCIRRSESVLGTTGGGSGSGHVRHEFVLLQCALGSDKGKVWMRLERLERAVSGAYSNGNGNGSSSNGAESSSNGNGAGAGPSWPKPNDVVSISSSEIELYDKESSRVEAHYVLSHPVPLRELAKMIEVISEESRGYQLWPENRYLFTSLIQELISGRPSRTDIAPDIRHSVRMTYLAPSTLRPANMNGEFTNNGNGHAQYAYGPANGHYHQIMQPSHNHHAHTHSSSEREQRGYTSRGPRPPRSASASGSRARPASAQATIMGRPGSASGVNSSAGPIPATTPRSLSRPSSRENYHYPLSSSPGLSGGGGTSNVMRAREAEMMKARARAVLKKRDSYTTSPEYFARSGWDGANGG